jgi:hypothetical protein
VLTDVVTISGLVGLLLTTSLLAWQTNAAVRQAKIANAIAGSTVLHDGSSALREILTLFVEHPQLRAYFYDGKLCPRSLHQRVRVITVAEMFADVLEDGMVCHRLVPTTESLEDWTGFCRDMLASSPTLYGLVAQHGRWWPQLDRIRTTPGPDSR